MESVTQIYLVRHGQTQWNKEQIFRGTRDVPLNASGREEARLAAEGLKDKPIEAVYTSPLTRARETAEAIARVHGLAVRPVEGLKDICFGEWEGEALQEVQKRYTDLYRRWIEEPHTVTFPGGESLVDVKARSVEAVKEIVVDHPEDAIAMVSHRVVNRVLICGVVGIDLARFWQIGQDTTAINLLTWKKGNFILTYLNDTCHLRSVNQKRVTVDF